MKSLVLLLLAVPNIQPVAVHEIGPSENGKTIYAKQGDVIRLTRYGFIKDFYLVNCSSKLDYRPQFNQETSDTTRFTSTNYVHMNLIVTDYGTARINLISVDTGQMWVVEINVIELDSNRKMR